MCEFILKAKKLGFSLEEIKEILHLRFSGERPCGCVREKLKEKIENIEKLIAELEARKKLLEELLYQDQEGQGRFCPLIESIR